MAPRDDAWLRHQQRRFMRPDAARYLRPDAARFLKPGTDPAEIYPALQLKYDGQPRRPEGEGGGRYTFGRMNGAAESAVGRPRVYITTRDGVGDGGPGDEESGQDWGIGDFLDSLLQAATILPGIGHNKGPTLEDPPEIPKSKPRRSPSTYLRTAAVWIGRALRLRNLAAIILFVIALKAIGWAWQKINEIITNLDPPRTMEELQAAVDIPRAGTEIHHYKMEQNESKRRNMTQEEIDAPGNRVRIPTLKHYQITQWYREPNKKYGGLSPRRYLASKPPKEHERVGRKVLRLFKVLKP